MQAADRKPCCITPAGDPVRLLQLTDTHLCGEPHGTLLGMDTDRSLKLVIERALRERSQPDLVLATGDLSDRGLRPAYDRLLGYLRQFSAPSCWLPGNHDDRDEMEAALGDNNNLCGEVAAGHWQIVLLDSQIPGEVGGEIGAAERARLRAALERAAEQGKFTLVCLHHQPVPVGSDWIDQQMIADAEEFWQIVDAFPGVKGVLWGHVHQQLDRMRGGTRLMASPSTCVQFATHSPHFKADGQPPGYRWLELFADGRIVTGVSRVTDAEFCVDLDSSGYL